MGTIERSTAASTIEKNKQALRELYEEIMNTRDIASLHKVIDPTFSSPSGKKGPAAFEEGFGPLLVGFPDIQWKVNSLIAEDNTVAVRWSWTGTHTGTFQFYKPTGNKITATGTTIYQMQNGKVLKSEVLPDRLGFLQSIDIIPDDLSALASNGSPDNMYFIDKFIVPASSKAAFYERVELVRSFIRKVPGFIKDVMLESTTTDGTLTCVAMSVWKDQNALNNAGPIVQEEYKKNGIDFPAFLQEWNIKNDRGIYSVSKAQ